MTKCVACNQPIDAGQQYIEVRTMPETDEAGNSLSLGGFSNGWAHWPRCHSKVVIHDGHYWLQFPSGEEVDMGPLMVHTDGTAVPIDPDTLRSLDFRGLQL